MPYKKCNNYRVYKATFPNGKAYIGYTKYSLKNRISQHYSQVKRSSNYVFHRALAKYPKTDVTWEILFETEDRELALKKEVYFIQFFKTRDFLKTGYNSTDGGEKGCNRRWSMESKQNMSRLKKEQYKNNPKLKQRISNAQKGRIPWNKGKKIGSNLTHASHEKRIETMKKRGTWSGKPRVQIKIISPNGQTRIYENIALASRETNIPDSVIRIYSQKDKSYKGYSFIRLS